MNWYLKVLKNALNFSGRARRTEFWMFVLFNMIFAIAATLLDRLFGTTIGGSTSALDYNPYGGSSFGVFSLLGLGWIYTIYSLAVLIPGFAVGIRRLHDIGKSGWSCLISLIPLVGIFILLVWFCKDSQAGENKWGANPKE